MTNRASHDQLLLAGESRNLVIRERFEDTSVEWYEATEVYHCTTFPHEPRLSSLEADWQRELAALWRLETDVNGGAYLQFFTNWGRESYVHASQALKKIGAHRMAEIIDQCQALVDEHFDPDALLAPAAISLLPNKIIGDDNTVVKAEGSVLPEPVVARIYELSYQFMSYPDDIGKLGMQFYKPHFPEIERLVNEKKDANRRELAAIHSLVEETLRAAEVAQIEKLAQGKACPRCGFSYAWDGEGCGHCRNRT